MFPWRDRCFVPLLLAFVASAVARSSTAQSAEDSPCHADYSIRARLDEGEKKFQGEETIRWTNESRDDVPDLWFHLYWNAFANDRSSFAVEAQSGREAVRNDEWGWTRVTSLEIGGEDRLAKLEFVSPDDKRPEDRTVFRVPLAKPARRGDTVVVRLSWEAKIPRVRERTGFKDDFLFIAQWFPKLGVYESGNGWNCHQFHSVTEFFADYGAYDVELDLPRAYEGKIGASGVQSGPSSAKDGRVVVRFSAPSEKDRTSKDSTAKVPVVHDFAWTADPHYVKYEATFHYDEWAARYAEEVDRVALVLGRARNEIRLRDVEVTVWLQPEHADQGQRHFDATCTALFFYGLWFGGYPYEHITVVDPCWGGGGAGGMEYPTLFTAGSRMFTKLAMQTPESVTVHECGHQFWYGLVGNNEFEAAWMDEGFNTFTQNEALAIRYGSRSETTDFAGLPFDGGAIGAEPGGNATTDALCGRAWRFPLGITLEPWRSSGFLDWWRKQPLLTFGRERIDPRETDRIGYLSDPDTDPIDKAAWLYCDRQSYRTNSYRRTATVLRSLEGLVGSERFLRGMRNYSERWRYAHPYPQDFFDAFVQGAKVDVAWYFEQAFRSTATLDWKVEVSQKVATAPHGYFSDAPGSPGSPGSNGQNGAFVKREEPPDKSKKPEDGAAAVAKDNWTVDLIVKRKGDLLLPLTIELTWADGSKEKLAWSRDEQAHSTWWKPLAGRETSPVKLVSAVLDPEHRYTLDKNLADNEWHDAVDVAAPLRWSERVFAQYAQALHWWEGLGG